MSAIASSTITSMEAILKEHYLSPDKIRDVQVESGPLINELLERAETTIGGKTIPFPVIQASGGGVGSIYTAAFASTQPANSVNFELTRSTTFGVLQLGGEVLIASEGLDNAFIADMVLEFDAKKRRLMQLMATYAYGDGKGVMGQVSLSDVVADAGITLADPATAVHFQVGDVIQLCATYGGANRTAGGGTAPTLTNGSNSYVLCMYVVGVSIIGPNAGTILVSATPGGASTALSTLVTDATAGDFIVLVGDAGQPTNVGGSGPAIPQGILAWCPPGGPASGGADDFFGVDRFGSTFLYGSVIDATANDLNLGSIREALTFSVAQLHSISARPDLIVMHPTAWYDLSLSLQSQGFYNGTSGQGPSGKGSFGFSELELPTPHGTIRVIADPMCVPTLNPSVFSPADGYSGALTAYVLETETWDLIAASIDGQIPFLEKRGTDNEGLLQVIGQDVLFASLKAYWQLGSHAPGHNAVVLLPNS
jgi:hypothetical protein